MRPQIRSQFAQQHSFIGPALGWRWYTMDRHRLRKRAYKIRIRIRAIRRPILANDRRLPAMLRKEFGETASPITRDVVARRKIKSEQEDSLHRVTLNTRIQMPRKSTRQTAGL